MAMSAEPGMAPALQTQARVPEGARIPDFFIVGHQKCGTTALWAMLRRHPQIFMPDQKEPRFLAPDLASRFVQRGEWKPDRRPRSLEQYLSLFAPAGPEQRAGEASPEYLRSSVAATRIAELQPAARVIAILREPASFLRSLHLQLVSSNVETQRDFRKALALEGARRRGKRIPHRCHHPESLLYSDHVHYVDQLRRFHAELPREHVLVLIYEDFKRDNETTLHRVLRFLEVDDTAPIEVLQTKPVKAVRSLALHQLVGSVRAARDRPAAASPVSRAANALMPTRLRQGERFRATWQRVVYTTPTGADDELMRELRRRFKGEVEAVSEYLDRDLIMLWGYDRVD
jgi:hypothetical protein